MSGLRLRPGFVHDALFYRSEEELLAAAVPFLRSGLDDGEVLLVNAPPRTLTLLSDALGHDPRIAFGGLGDQYATPERAIAGYQRYFDRRLADGAPGIRAIGEITLPGDPVERWAWDRMESLYNDLLAGYPVWGVCPFHTGRLPAETLNAAERSHPAFLVGRRRQVNPRYQRPAEFLRTFPPLPPDPLEATPPGYLAEDLPDLPTLRQEIYLSAMGTRIGAEAVDDFVSAVSEVATNAATHGRPPVRVRVWSRPERLLCTVTDQGAGVTDPLAGYGRPPRGGTAGGIGLWVARQMCGRMDFSRTPDGFTVRLSTSA